MIDTMKTIITTNVRTPSDDYAQYKMMAEEMGMSFNAYYNWIMKRAANIIPLGGDIADIRKKRKLDLRDLVKEMRKLENKPETEFSEDDKIIYGL